VETEKWHEAYSGFQYHPILSEEKARMKRFRRMGILNLNKDASILEVGSAIGTNLNLLKAQGFNSLSGIEPSQELVDRSTCKDLIKVNGAADIQFPDNHFDCVFVLGVMHHFPDLEYTLKSMEEIKRVLKPGGVFCYNEPTKSMTRTLGEWFLMSPFSNLFFYSRRMKTLYAEEEEELGYWLKNENNIMSKINEIGFATISYHKSSLRSTFRAKLA